MAGPEVLRPFLDRTLRVGIKDGRKLTGRFKCTDHDANVILASAVERMPGADENEEPRFLGLVMIPGRYIVNIELKAKEEEDAVSKTTEHSSQEKEETSAPPVEEEEEKKDTET
ncbi:N-alpha-acetyltransferase 38, NatC auxiliary subunit-like [Oscarella lobularis]|uniref:N-alpha-acetyltransferase 38, NatC auxiliary subunit-like n=1 Tax=Oscarella lobularis TaxID=121494 RepID=UPI0033136DD0